MIDIEYYKVDQIWILSRTCYGPVVLVQGRLDHLQSEVWPFPSKWLLWCKPNLWVESAKSSASKMSRGPMWWFNDGRKIQYLLFSWLEAKASQQHLVGENNTTIRTKGKNVYNGLDISLKWYPLAHLLSGLHLTYITTLQYHRYNSISWDMTVHACWKSAETKQTTKTVTFSTQHLPPQTYLQILSSVTDSMPMRQLRELSSFASRGSSSKEWWLCQTTWAPISPQEARPLPMGCCTVLSRGLTK